MSFNLYSMSQIPQVPVDHALTSLPYRVSEPSARLVSSYTPLQNHAWPTNLYGYTEPLSGYGNVIPRQPLPPSSYDHDYSWGLTMQADRKNPAITVPTSARSHVEISGSGVVAQTHDVASSSQRDATRRPCLWGQCRIMLDDHSNGGIARHLLEYHTDILSGGAVNAGRQFNRECASICQWNLKDGQPCRSEHVYRTVRTLARHISSHHMGAGRVTCEVCGVEFSRKDALKRHQNVTCRGPSVANGQGSGPGPLRRTRRLLRGGDTSFRHLHPEDFGKLVLCARSMLDLKIYNVRPGLVPLPYMHPARILKYNVEGLSPNSLITGRRWGSTAPSYSHIRVLFN
ncbi:uncharacterized protein B0H18DRAFT_954607 [Fomitopsis serialis]|uniref:uncharacterized protein n=1 Tax=Fomitopsis serialis TaxID=139415 RepID=UPI002008039E|nr:uncharacterized protein B0H18DRAFT_954607 [Neoantrodia serialis]KAH9926701.1 hypothetical protein B0H18DRAFT_954607 [Neoantrodia serialis]